jgi:hypothetical protein
MDQLSVLKRSVRIWRFAAVLAIAALALVLMSNGFAFSQREQAKDQPRDKPADALQWNVDKSQLSSTYTNFCQASGTPEELILDFGLNPGMVPDPKQPVRINTRVVMSFYTAKRLESLLHQTVQQHEKAFGPLELDFNKRMLPAAK